MSLTYPSVLGAVIYSFLDASIQVSIFPFFRTMATLSDPSLVPTEAPKFHFFEAFGLTDTIGLFVYLTITLFVIVHYSVDYLYSKYSEANYGLRNFLWDTAISLLLAAAYIILSNNVSKGIQQTRLALAIFWFALACTYLVFLWWDFRAYLQSRDADKTYARFYLGMVRWFEVSAIISFTALAVLPFFIREVNWFSYAYTFLAIAVLGTFSVWFCSKVRVLETLSREKEQALELG